MKCPKCNSDNIGVTETVPGAKRAIYRSRKCRDCGAKFRTIEVIDNGSPEFDRGYAKALSQKYLKRLEKERKGTENET